MADDKSLSAHILPGKTRRTRIDRYMRKGNSKAVVLLSGFVENGYWYQIPLAGYSLAAHIAEQGYDVHVMSFLPELQAARSRRLMLDSSYEETISGHLPRYHSHLCDQYKQIDYIGHSYGATLMLSFLMGYQRSSRGGTNAASFAPSNLQARQNQRRVRSVVSLAGFYGLNAPALYMAMPARQQLASTSGDLAPQIERLIAQLYKSGLTRLLPVIPTHKLGSLKYIPYAHRMLILGHLLSPGFMPFVALGNTHLPALHKALAYGTSPETWENLLTLLSMTKGSSPTSPQASRALTGFSADLQGFHKPILFLQGNKDLVTSPSMIKERAFASIGSAHKRFTTLANFGHQDLFTAKNPTIVQNTLSQWLEAGI